MIEVKKNLFIHKLTLTPEQKNIINTVPPINRSVPKSFCNKINTIDPPTTAIGGIIPCKKRSLPLLFLSKKTC